MSRNPGSISPLVSLLVLPLALPPVMLLVVSSVQPV